MREHTGLDVTLNAAMFGRPVGTMIWSAMVPGRASVAAASSQLLADPAYLDLVERGAELFDGNGDDYLRQVIDLCGIDESNPRPAPFSQVWTAQVANGQMDHAMQWGIDIAHYVHDMTSVPIGTLADCYGEFATMTWVALFESAEQADAVNEQIVADAEWIKRVNYAEDLFIPRTIRVYLNRLVE